MGAPTDVTRWSVPFDVCLWQRDFPFLGNLCILEGADSAAYHPFNKGMSTKATIFRGICFIKEITNELCDLSGTTFIYTAVIVHGVPDAFIVQYSVWFISNYMNV